MKKTEKRPLTSERKGAILKEVGLETPHNTKKADTMDNEINNTKKFNLKTSIDWFFRGNAKSKISKEEIFEKTFNHFLTFELCDMETTKILDFISQFEEEMVEDIEEDIVEEVKDTKKKFVMTEEMVEDMGDICAFWDRELYKEERTQKVEEVSEKITYEKVLEIVKNYFRSEDYVWLVCDEAKEGWVRTTVDEIADSLTIWVCDKEADLDELKKKLATYREIYLDELYVQVEYDGFTDKDVKRGSVMYVDDKFWIVAGEDYVRENPLQVYKYYDEEYVEAAKDFITEDKDYSYKLQIQNCIDWMFRGENTNLNVDESVAFEDTFNHFLSTNLEDFNTADVYKYLEKYVLE